MGISGYYPHAKKFRFETLSSSKVAKACALRMGIRRLRKLPRKGTKARLRAGRAPGLHQWVLHSGIHAAPQPTVSYQTVNNGFPHTFDFVIDILFFKFTIASHSANITHNPLNGDVCNLP
jgi:hypothetical protein